ncbi:MAG: ribosome recycling factor [Hyphomicrobiaceae bacterium]|jgi:ribosome recycling factor
MIEEILADLKTEMGSTIESFKRDLSRIRAGRAHPSLLDGVMVEYYGTDTSLSKIANVSAPESRMLLIQPFDQTSVTAIEKAIRTSADLGLSPMSDGRILRIPIPELTEDRRRDLVKRVRKEAESYRISARNHRRDANDMLKQAEADKEIGEDDHRSAADKVQKLTNECIAKIDEITKAKEADVMAV